MTSRKKKDLRETLQTLTGHNSIERPPLPEEYKEDKDITERYPITEEMIKGLEKERKKNVGRPKKTEKERKPQERATFILDRELVYKLKFIALKDRRLLKDVIAEAITDYIEKWEEETTSNE